jgi:hypothetical protein
MPQAALHTTDCIVATPSRAFDTGLRRRPFPGGIASLLPGLPAAIRTRLPPAGDDELTNTRNTMNYVTVLPPVLLGTRNQLTDAVNQETALQPTAQAPGIS